MVLNIQNKNTTTVKNVIISFIFNRTINPDKLDNPTYTKANATDKDIR